MTRNDVPWAVPQSLQSLETADHRPGIEDDRIGAHALEIVVHVTRVAREHHPTAARAHAHRLDPHRVATDVMNAHAGSDFRVARLERDSPPVDVAYHGDDMVRRVGAIEVSVRHARPRRELHLLLLQVEARFREVIERAGVVEVQMGDDNIGHSRGVDPDHAQTLGGRIF